MRSSESHSFVNLITVFAVNDITIYRETDLHDVINGLYK